LTLQVKFLALTLALLALQQFVASTFPEAFRPDLLLILALALGLRQAAIGSLLGAFGLGFVVDLLSGAPVGTYALLRGTACAATRLADRTLYLRAPLPWGVYSAVYQGVDFVLLGAVSGLLLPEAGGDWGRLAAQTPGAMIATGLAAIPLAALLKRWGLVPAPGTGASLLSPGRPHA
jgi:rod shape-determining protein MreD